jgi:hypothetical protein
MEPLWGVMTMNVTLNRMGSNCVGMCIGNLTLWFSYTTLVAFKESARGLVVVKNYWGPTTGKHLNWIDGGNKAARVSRETFGEAWTEVLSKHGLGG